MKVHPLADSFPLLSQEEFQLLVNDISVNGLINPIVLDAQGQLIDGRNRLLACEKAQVEPRFITVDQDPISYILSANVTRRHLSKGQQAMAVAMAYPDGGAISAGRGNKKQKLNFCFSGTYITQARYVLRYTPDLATQVMNGGSLNEAYDIAQKQQQQREKERRQFEELRTSYPDFASQNEKLW